MANVRFDVEKEEEIHYFDNYDDYNDSINGSLPDPSLGFKDASMGSDVLKTIEKFLSNTQSTVCGSRIFLIMQRYPNETDITQLVTKMRLFHVYIAILSPIVPSGGLYSSTMYNLASKTNGLCFFAYSEDFGDQYQLLPKMDPMQLAYAANVNQVSGELVSLPELKLNQRNNYLCAMTVQDHGPLDQFQYFNLTSHVVEDPSRDFNIYMNKTTVEKRYGNSNHVNHWLYFGAGTNKLTLEVKYADGKPEQLQVRCYGDNIDYWVPYDN
ncbi:hypothetical protein CAEBREN_21947 [Caenorhabditis brenneri]|uniref:DUF7154 domain-containing protein n=1 Tax=Caenorhabditis brenneri TaxID=135651 RepID=G0NCS2_CAEBE|nr:hypothetical protein CAEBREN_21947 [Caenorhabditis brenneri]